VIPELPPEQRVERAPSQPITSAVGEPSALAVLRNRPFLLLWLSQAATQIGGNMVIFGLTFIIFSSTNSSAAVSGLLLTFLVPSVLFSAVAGVYVDRLDRRRILVVTNLIRAGAFGAMLLVGDHLLLLYLLNTLVAIASTLFAPAEAAMIPRLVPRSQLLAANGIFTLTLNAAFPIGFALLGGIVVNLAGAPALLMLVALLYLVAAGFCYTLPPAPPAEEGDREHPTVLGAVHDAEQAVGSTFGQLSEGIDFIRQNRSVSWSLVYLGVTASLIGVLGSLGPGFASKTLGLNPKDIVVVVLPMGFGIVMGLLLLNSYGRLLPRRRLIEGGLISLGVLIVLLSLAGPITRFLQRVQTASRLVDPSSLVSLLAVVVAIAILTGIAYAIVAISSQTQLQEDLPADVRGRVYGVLFTLISVASFVPIIVVGPIADIVGTTPVILLVGILTTLAGAASVVSHRGTSTGATLPPIAPPEPSDRMTLATEDDERRD